MATLLDDPTVSRHFALDAIVTPVDAVNGTAQLDAHFESLKQAAVADQIVLSKVDLVGESQKALLVERLRGINPGAVVHEVVMGDIDPKQLLNSTLAPGRSRTGELDHWLRAHDNGSDHDGHAHRSGIRTFTFFRDEPVDPAGLSLWLNALAGLRGANLLRVKGLVNVNGDPVVVHAVQHVFHDPQPLEAWPTPDRRSRIVCITHELEKEQLEVTLEALSYRPRARPAPHAVDPADYAAFVATMKGIMGGARRQ